MFLLVKSHLFILICLTAGELRAVNGRSHAGYCGVAEQPCLPQPGQAHLHPHPRHARPHPSPIQVHPHHSPATTNPSKLQVALNPHHARPHPPPLQVHPRQSSSSACLSSPHASAGPDLGLYLGTPRPQQAYQDCTFVCL
jgi:hypothetical protein